VSLHTMPINKTACLINITWQLSAQSRVCIQYQQQTLSDATCHTTNSATAYWLPANILGF